MATTLFFRRGMFYVIFEGRYMFSMVSSIIGLYWRNRSVVFLRGRRDLTLEEERKGTRFAKRKSKEYDFFSHTLLSKKPVKILSFRYFQTCYLRVSIHSKVCNVCVYMVTYISFSKVIEILDGWREGTKPKGSSNVDQKADDDAVQDARTIRWVHLGLDCAIVDPHSASSFLYWGEFSAQKKTRILLYETWDELDDMGIFFQDE